MRLAQEALEDIKMSSKVNYGKYRVNTDGLVFRADGYSNRSYDHNSTNWKDLTPSGFDITLESSGLYNESGYYEFRRGSNNLYGAISGENFTGLRSLGVFKDKNSSFTIESFFKVNTKGGAESDDGAVIFGNTDHNKSGFSYGIVAHTGNGGGVSGLHVVIASDKEDNAGGAGTHTHSPETGVTGVLSNPLSPSISNDTFCHAAMTYDSSDGVMAAYLDGVIKDSGTFPSSQELHQGTGNGTYQQFFIGGNNSSGINVDVGMVSCYNRALSSGEVYGNCKAVKHRYGGGY